MPYARCSRCGLSSYAVRGWASRPECPGCGAVLDLGAPSPRPDSDPDPAAHGLHEVLALALQELDMDVAFVAEVVEGREVFHVVEGDGERFGISAGMSHALIDTVCEAVLAGRAPRVIPDVRDPGVVEALRLDDKIDVGAYVGAPIGLRDARLYMLCCLAAESRPELGEAEDRFMLGLRETVRARLEDGVAPSLRS